MTTVSAAQPTTGVMDDPASWVGRLILFAFELACGVVIAATAIWLGVNAADTTLPVVGNASSWGGNVTFMLLLFLVLYVVVTLITSLLSRSRTGGAIVDFGSEEGFSHAIDFAARLAAVVALVALSAALF